MRSFPWASELHFTEWRTAPCYNTLLLLSLWPLTIATSELSGMFTALPRVSWLERKWFRRPWLQCLSPNEWLWRARLHCWFRRWWGGGGGLGGVAFVLELSGLLVSTGMSGCERYWCSLTGLCIQVRKKHNQGVSSWPGSFWNHRNLFKRVGKAVFNPFSPTSVNQWKWLLYFCFEHLLKPLLKVLNFLNQSPWALGGATSYWAWNFWLAI